MQAIDGHFHVVPIQFVEAIRSGAFADVVRSEREGGAGRAGAGEPAPQAAGNDPGGGGGASERLIYRTPPGVVVEPDTSLSAALYDERRIVRALDEMKLDAAAIAPSPGEFYYWAAPEAGERIARAFNDGIAAMVRAHPDRFIGLGTVPMQDGERAARELARAVGVLGLRGIEICTHINGVDLDDAGLAPLYAAAERLRAPLFIHPQNEGDMRRLRDYHLWNLVGFPTETALAAARLIFGGVFERFPGLRVILAHGGGYFPYQLGRLDHGYAARQEARERIPRRPSEYLGSIYCDSLTHNDLSLRFLLDRIGDDHVVIGSDYPFGMRSQAPVDLVRGLRLGRGAEARVLGRNLARLLNVA
jgi:aminocarboxymuconate-semialdehyde decarboxylase